MSLLPPIRRSQTFTGVIGLGFGQSVHPIHRYCSIVDSPPIHPQKVRPGARSRVLRCHDFGHVWTWGCLPDAALQEYERLVNTVRSEYLLRIRTCYSFHTVALLHMHTIERSTPPDPNPADIAFLYRTLCRSTSDSPSASPWVRGSREGSLVATSTPR